MLLLLIDNSVGMYEYRNRRASELGEACGAALLLHSAGVSKRIEQECMSIGVEELAR